MKTLLNYPGGKKRIAPWIISHMPDHHSYLEPYFGGGAVLFSKAPSAIETVNDLDSDVVNFFQVIKDPESRKELQEWISYTPYARQVYDDVFAAEPAGKIERAGCFVVRSMMGQGFRLTEEKSGWKKDVYGRESSYAVKYWNELPESIAEMAVRLKQVQVEKRPALELIKEFDHENVLIYLDPPYVMSTRGGRPQYKYEMSDQDHIDMLEAVIGSRAKIMISGYDCELYDFYLGDWNKVQIAARTQSNARRMETLWMNYEPEEAQMTLQI